jgi:hypothetical protein
MEGIKVMKTVTPEDTLSESEWMEYVKAGRLAPNPEARERAKDMMIQYRADTEWLDKFKATLRRIGM